MVDSDVPKHDYLEFNQEKSIRSQIKEGKKRSLLCV